VTNGKESMNIILCLPELVGLVLCLFSYILFLFMLVSTIGDHVMDQPVSNWTSATETCVQLQASPHEIYGGQSGTGTVSSLSMWVLPSHFHSTNDPYSFIHLPLTILNLRSWFHCQIMHLKYICLCPCQYSLT
jgi:hypothetical protein